MQVCIESYVRKGVIKERKDLMNQHDYETINASIIEE